MKIGIVDFENYLPEGIITAEELSPLVNIPADILRTKMGINQKHVGGPEDHPAKMAVKAAKRLLERNSIDPLDLDMILFAGETYCEYVCWTAAIKIQNELGADNAYAWDLGFRCAGTPLALKVAKDMMKSDDDIKEVLIVGGNTNAYLIDYQDKNQSFMFDMSPAGCAILLRKDYPHNEVLETGIITDHVFCDDVIGKWGGTLYPIDDAIAGDPEKLRKAKLIHLSDPEGMKKRLAERSLPNFTNAVNIALRKSGFQQEDLDFISITHINPKSHAAILNALGMTEKQSIYLENDGHCGHVDQTLALDYGIKSGAVKEGSLCALLGAGTGYAFACTIVRWGEGQEVSLK